MRCYITCTYALVACAFTLDVNLPGYRTCLRKVDWRPLNLGYARNVAHIEILDKLIVVDGWMGRNADIKDGVATVIAIYTDWEFTRIKGVGWKCAGITHFAAVITRIRDPKTTALIFASGKMLGQTVCEIRESKTAHTIQVSKNIESKRITGDQGLNTLQSSPYGMDYVNPLGLRDEDETELFRLRFLQKCISQNAVAYAFKGKFNAVGQRSVQLHVIFLD
ncbi:TATA-box-binding protein isoform X2 [Tanacetum coccineum]